MKKSLILTALIFACSLLNAKLVKFSVDMTGLLIDSNGVHVAGDFQDEAGFPADWEPHTTSMSQEAGSDIYSVVVDIPAFTKYEFKFFNGKFGYNVEFVPLESRVDPIINDNRWIYIDSLDADTMELSAIIFAANAPAGQYLLRFYLDMQNEASVDTVNGVHVAGTWQGFDPALTRMYSFDGNVYQYIAYIDTANAAVETEYKFANGNSSGDFETVPGPCSNGFTNRGIMVTYDLLLDTVCYSSCGPCAPASISQRQEPLRLKVYPQPAGEFAVIETEGLSPGTSLKVFSSNGALVRELNPDAMGRFVLKRDGIPAGMYFLLTGDSRSGALCTRLIFE